VARADALVTEIAIDLEDALHAADYQALEVELGRDAQIHVDVEGVVMGGKRPRLRTARNRL